MPDAAHDLAERITHIETDIQIMKAVSGRVAMPASLLAFLWGILLVALSAVGFVVRLDARVSDMATAIQANQQVITAHVSEPWHSAAGEKYKAIDERQSVLEARIREIEHVQRGK